MVPVVWYALFLILSFGNLISIMYNINNGETKNRWMLMSFMTQIYETKQHDGRH
jgi:hypothetical protein